MKTYAGGCKNHPVRFFRRAFYWDRVAAVVVAVGAMVFLALRACV